MIESTPGLLAWGVDSRFSLAERARVQCVYEVLWYAARRIEHPCIQWARAWVYHEIPLLEMGFESGVPEEGFDPTALAAFLDAEIRHTHPEPELPAGLYHRYGQYARIHYSGLVEEPSATIVDLMGES